jgi:RNA recognition motif-containing protein
LSTIIAKLSFQLDTEKIKNIQLIEDNEKITKEVGSKNIELEKTKFRMNLISNELSTRNTEIEKIMQRNKNDLQEEKIRHYRATEDLNHRNADLEKEHVLSSTLIRTLRDEENRNIKFVENLQYQIKLLKSDVNVDNEHLIFDLKQKIIELIEDLKWANMMGSPSIHIFKVELEITNDFLEYKFSKYGTVKKVYILQNPPTGEAFVTFENPSTAQRACSASGY